MRKVSGLHVLLILASGLFLSPVFGFQFAGGAGKPDDPYQVATREQLISIGQDPNLLDKHFALVEDIDLDPNLPGGQVFTRAVIAPDLDPGKDDFQGHVFTGSLDGKGHAIRHMTIEIVDAEFVGLFGRAGKAARIDNLILDGVRISGPGYCIGGLVGYSRGSISNCRVTGCISGGTGEWCSCLGLVAGRAWGRIAQCRVEGSIDGTGVERGGYFGLLAWSNSALIRNCTAAGTITGAAQSYTIGGLVGANTGSIADCRAECDITTHDKYGGTGGYGGLVGSNRGPIYRSCATGSVSCGIYSGKLGGLAGSNAAIVIGSYATGSASGTTANADLGGLVGANYGDVVFCYATGGATGYSPVGGLVGGNLWGSISQSYSTGRPVGGQGSWISIGGLAGSGGPGSVNRCFWDVDTSGLTKSAGGTGLSTPQIQDAQTLRTAGWDFVHERGNGTTDMWSMPQGGGYPVLTVFSEEYESHGLEGTGTPDDPYRIATAEDLGAIPHYDAAACYELVANIDLNDITWTTAVIPSFEGRFDGSGFTISNLVMKGECFLGLFGVLSGEAVVENLDVDNAKIAAGASASKLGLLAVENSGRIANCHVTGSIFAGDKDHTRLAGTNFGTIVNCDPAPYSGPYTVIIADPQATRNFLRFKGIGFDDAWIPDGNDLAGLDAVLREYLDSDLPIDTPGELDQEYVLANLPRYNREYSGYIIGGSKYVICSMHIPWDEFNSPPDSQFTIIFDGGCSVVQVIFDAETKEVIYIACNGYA